MTAPQSAIYEELIIESNNDPERTVNLIPGTVSISYYEDIFSPTVTAKMQIINTGDTIDGESLYNGLPLRGCERVHMKIQDSGKTYAGEDKPGLDFASDPLKYLYVSSISNLLRSGETESFVLHLISKEAISNETTRVMKKYTGTIGQSAEDILTNILGIKKKSRIAVDATLGEYSFIGNMKKPFHVLSWLASKAIPVESKDATAGFLFYQTKEGFNFRSIDDLIGQESKATYTSIEVPQSSIERNNDFNIKQYSIKRNQNISENLRLGLYCTQRMFFNPLNFQFSSPEEGIFTVKNDVVKKLGNDDIQLPKLSEDSEKTLDQIPSRIVSGLVDIGVMSQDVSKEPNADPNKNKSQSIMRYHSLHLQLIDMVVPCNTDLMAGDLITCVFPKMSRKDKENDGSISGKYIIKQLCHHFETTKSYTSMTLVRDTFGFYGE